MALHPVGTGLQRFRPRLTKKGGCHHRLFRHCLCLHYGACGGCIPHYIADKQPEYPHNAKMLTPMQRDLAVWRLRQEAGAGEGEEQISHTKAFVSAATDPKVRSRL